MSDSPDSELLDAAELGVQQGLSDFNGWHLTVGLTMLMWIDAPCMSIAYVAYPGDANTNLWALRCCCTGEHLEFPTFPDLLDHLKARRDALSPQ